MKYLISFILFQVLSCTHSSVQDKISYSLPEKIIDAHTHWENEEDSLVEPSDAMEREFSENHIVGAVVHLTQKTTSTPPRLKDSATKFVICAAAVPPTKPSDLEEGLRSKRFRCLKIYLGYVPKPASDAFYHPFYQLAEKFNIPVVFHTGDTYDKKAQVKFTDPLSVDEIAVAYPKVKFLIAHLGNPWIDSAAEVIYKNDNVYADLSALMLGDISKADAEAVQKLLIDPIRKAWLYVDNPKKFLFGSDWSLLKIGPYIHAIQRAIPKEHWNAVFYSNAKEFFGFD